MNHPRRAFVGLFAGLVAVGFFTSLAGAQAAASSKIGVIDLRMVYTSLQETKDSQHSLQGFQDQLKTKTDADQGQLKVLTDAMNQKSKPGTPEREKEMEDFDTKSLQFQLEEQQMKVNIVRTQAKQLVEAYKQIQVVVKDLASKKGMDLVIVSSGQDVPDNAMDIANLETLGNLVFGRNVMFAADKVDLSAEVIAKLDADYKSGPAKH